MAQFIVAPAAEEDVRVLAEIFFDSFAENPEFKIMRRNVTREVQIESDMKGYTRAMNTPGRKFFKVVEVETGKVAGWCSWRYPHKLTPEQVAAGVGIDRLPENWPPGTEVGLANDFMRRIIETRAKNYDYEKEYFVNILAMRPEYQRKGLGGLLLEHGLASADRDGARTYIEASVTGFSLYKKYGWKEFDEIAVDSKPYGGQGLEITKLMMREPQPLKK